MLESLIDASLYINSSNDSEEEELPCYEKISDNEDIYLIRTKHTSYELHRKRLIGTLKELHKYANLSIAELDERQGELLASTVETTRLLNNTKALKDLVLKDIQHIYGHIKNPIPGTVGAFFIGCFNNDDFNGPIGCNPRCAASMMKCEGMSFECGDTILIFSKNQFKPINNKVTTHAYVYIEDENFVKFNRYELSLLNKAGIKSVTMIYGNADGSYREITNEIILEHIETNDSSNAWWIILLIIIILLLLLGFGYYYGNMIL
jgi:hypothetical protein